ncbi:SDR family oxidoreductase [Halopiger djelfimassiliensis]|uniref:SDR family oxidoreductase n=1 Tax=Halopiger djelfimassiliensis TaxID=1293047 RepID=UPI000677E428|nr:SDR family oxidoreductase [Halopiger djelfimassiliensis]
MRSPTVLITGCASGIGTETARAFDERGWTVYATDPDRDDLEALAELGCETATLDVTDAEQVDTVVERIDDETGRLDCLVNNAGYGQIGPVEEVPTEAVERQFDVNTFGQHRLIRAALPIMRRQGHGRIVNISSVYGRTFFPGQGAYTASKWAIEGLSDALRVEVSDHGIDVVLIEPGPVETNFGNRALAETDRLEETGAYDWFYRLFDEDRYDRRFLDKAVGYIQPERVADVIVDAVHAKNPDARYVVGPWKYQLWLGSLVPTAVRDRLFETVKRLP